MEPLNRGKEISSSFKRQLSLVKFDIIKLDEPVDEPVRYVTPTPVIKLCENN